MIKFIALVALTVAVTPLKAPVRTVVVPWTAPVATSTWPGCSAAMPKCYYYVYRATLPRSGVCPVAGGPSYFLLNGAAPTAALSYTDTRAPRQSVCYYARTVQNGRQSTPSNVRMFNWVH